MELKILTDKEINEEVANEIVELINKKPNAVLGLATGGSPVGVYKELIKKYNEKDMLYSMSFLLSSFYAGIFIFLFI